LLASALLTASLATAPPRLWPVCLALAALVGLATRPRWAWLWRRSLVALPALGALTAALALADPPRALAVGARAVAALVVALSVASRIELASLPGALRVLGAPRELAATVHAMLWQIEHVADEGRRLLLARQLRGAERVGPEVLAQLLIRTGARAERVDLAMRLRGADGPPDPRAHLCVADVLVALGCLALGVGLHLFG
jgi:energy-coupling factor transporter transmembrane protein EcfT